MSNTGHAGVERAHDVQIASGAATLEGELSVPAGAQGVVLFAHGSGSSRHSPRNQYVARVLRAAGVGTLLFDLLTREEEAVDIYTRHLRFDIQLLAGRLVDATNWLKQPDELERLRVGYFGASTGGGAALVAAAELGEEVGAVVSRGGRPDVAGERALQRVKAPTLLVGSSLGGVGRFAGGLAAHFAGQLPPALVLPFSYVLPFAEVTLGALILLGLFNVFAFSLSGLLLVALTFGTAMLGDAPTVAHNVQYALVNFVLLSFADYNGYSVDRLRRPRPPVGNP